MVPIGYRTLLYRYKKYNRGSGRKRTNEQYAWVNSSTRRELCNTAFPVCTCGPLTKILQRYWYADSSSLTTLGLISSDSSLCSSVDWSLASPFANRLLELLFRTLFSRSLTYFWSPEISSPKPFVWFRAKTDKGIVCLADHLHSVTFCFFIFNRLIKNKIIFFSQLFI